MMTPLSVRVLTWPDVPEAWREALGHECVRVLFVPSGKRVGTAWRGKLADLAVGVDGGSVHGWLEATPTPGVE